MKELRTDTGDISSRGIKIMYEKMEIVDTARFIFLVKTENFYYTKLQIDLFGDDSVDANGGKMNDKYTGCGLCHRSDKD